MELFKKVWPTLVIALVVFILFLTNYHPGTILTGGDNLHPEYNLGLNIKRSIFSVWQEYQSLGLLGGMGHASDLLRQLFLLPFSWFLPVESLRYLWTFLTLFIGTLGAFFLIRRLLSSITPSPLMGEGRGEGEKLQATALVGALFYLLNLSTLQAYYTPFEVFTAHFAALPWLFLTTINFFQKPGFRSFFYLSLVLFLSTPAAYVPTLFVVFLMASFILGFFSIKDKGKWGDMGKSFAKYYLLIFIINSFWLLPFAYFTLTNSGVNVGAKINQMATENIFEMNKEFGDVFNVGLLKGFWFNNVEPNLLVNNNTYMLLPWKTHLENPFITGIGIIFFLMVLGGFFLSFKIKNRLLFGFSALFLFAFTMLATGTPPFSWIDSLFRNYVPLAGQVFRFPFTKFSILASLTYGALFAVALSVILNSFQDLLLFRFRIKSGMTKYIVPIFAAILLMIYMFPAFKGQFFYEKETIVLPNDYKETFNYFKNEDPTARIANFPQDTFWSWHFYDWGYSGSGFLWYGIKQPILDRAFDVWSKSSEQYYYEISNALYAKDRERFNLVLEKYQVKFLLVDRNIFNTTSPKSLFSQDLEEIIKDTPQITKQKTFGKVDVYKVELKNNPQNFVFSTNNLSSVNPYIWSTNDVAFFNHGNYISQSSSDYEYPLQSLFSLKNVNKNDYKITQDEDFIYLSNKIKINSRNSKLFVPAYFSKEKYINAHFYAQKDSAGNTNLRLKLQTPQIFLEKEKITGDELDNILITFPQGVESLALGVNGNETKKVDLQNSLSTYLLTSQDNIVSISDNDGLLQNYAITDDYLSQLSLNDEVDLKNYIGKEVDFIVKVPRIDDNNLGKKIDLSSFIKLQNCDRFRENGNVWGGVINEGGKKILQIEAQHATACTSSYLPNMPHDESYAFFVSGKNIEGRNLHVWVLNEDEQYAPYDNYIAAPKDFDYSFIVPPLEENGRSYSIHLDSISISHDKSSNEVDKVSVSYIPQRFITSLILSNKQLPDAPILRGNSNLKVSHPNESLYFITRLGSINQTIVLSQSYDPMWKAYQVSGDNFLNLSLPFIFGKEVKDHVKINNWENGWRVDDGQDLVIVYLPQYLEYLGFLLLVIFAVWSIKYYLKKSDALNHQDHQTLEQPLLLEEELESYQPTQLR